MSTTYCNSDKKLVEEKLYPSHGDWKEAIRIAEESDRNMMDILTQKYIHPLPNTYTYAKSLAEHVVNDLCSGKIPAVIVRPSIGRSSVMEKNILFVIFLFLVINMRKEPLPGWTDNLNGPIGLSYAGGQGKYK